MKILLAVKSCAQDVAIGANQAIRETWRKDYIGFVYFFLGRIASPQLSLNSDEVSLPCGDGYFALSDKTREILKWSLARNYDFTFLADTDTWLNPTKLLACGFENYDLTGLISGAVGVPRAHRGYWAWPSGGAGYWLSKRAAKIIADTNFPDEAEDRMVGQILGPYFQRKELTAYSCPGFHVEGGITLHAEARAQRRDYDPAWMLAMNTKWGKK